ncbi:MAG: hypothetical protein F4Z51_04250 [Chloroflexi bacterium]|nr:hypothetical protein [Chloroflexota bacterium]MYD17066.1 hypothetical protein [Chloroflexota bacterium]
MCRPTIAVSAALLASLAVLCLLTELAETQTALTASSARVDEDSLAITLSATADAASTADASDFTVSAGDEELTINSADVSGTTITLTLADGVGDPDCDSAAVTVSYERSGSSITASGSELQDFADLSVSNQTDKAPAIDSIETDATGRNIHVTFCEAIGDISFQWSDFSAFTLTAGGTRRPINDLVTPAAMTGRLELQLAAANAIQEGEAITLAFAQDDASEDHPLRDLDQGRKLVESWSASDEAVTNNVDSPPKLVSVTALWDVITLTYSETLDEDSVPDKSAFTVTDRPYSVTIDSVAVTGKTVTLGVSAVIRGGLDPKFQLSYVAPGESPLQQADGAKQAGDFDSQAVESSTPTTKPVVVSAEVSGATLTITFDMPLKNVAGSAAFSVSGAAGVSVSAASFSGKVVKLTLSAALSSGDSLTVSYEKPDEPPRIEARNNRDADSFSNQAVTNSTPDPAPTFDSAVINAAGDTLTITMSGDLLETSAGQPAASAFTLSGGTAAVGAVSVSGASVALSLSPKADLSETITVAYTQPAGASEGKLQSLAGGHLVATWPAQSLTNNADGVPRPTSATVNGATLRITFDRALDAMSQPAASTFTLSGTTATTSTVAISGSTVMLTLSAAVAHDKTITVGYTKPQSGGIKRSGQALFGESFSSLDVTNEAPDPSPAFVSASVNAGGDKLTIAMSADLLETSKGVPAAGAFTLTGGTAAVGAVSVSGTTVSLTLSPKADLGETITVTYTQPTGTMDGKLQSLTGGHVVASWSAESATNNADGVPRPTSAAVNGSTLTVAFDRALDSMSKPAATAFTLGGTTATVSTVSISNADVTLALSATVAHDDVITLGYARPENGGIKRDGQAFFAESFSALSVDNKTPDPTPTLASASINAAGDTLAITMSGDLLETSAGQPAASAFTLSGGTAAVGAVSVSGTTVTLTLSPKADLGETITAAYAQPTGATDGKLQSLTGGHLVSSWSAESVTNNADGVPRPAGASVNGATLTITFDRSLDAMSKPAASTFTLGGTTVTVSSLGIADSTITLTLSAAVAHDDVISVSYVKPETGGIKRSGQALFARSFSSLSVTNETPEPLIRSVVGDEGEIEVTFSPELDTTSTPDSSAFSLGEGGPSIDSVAVGVMSVTLGLAIALSEGGEYTLTYRAPSESPLKTADAESLASFSETVTNDTDVAPQLESATARGATISLIFDQALDGDSALGAAAFTITASQAASVNAVSYDGEDGLSLTLSRSLVGDESATLGYVQPSSAGIADPGGKRTASFSVALENQTDTAPVPASGTVTDDEIVIVLDQELYGDPRFNPLADDSVVYEHFTLTGTVADITTIDISNDGPGSVGKIVLTLSEEVKEGNSITVRYFPGSSQIRIRDDDAGMNRVEIDNYQLTNLTKTPPTVESATLDGASLSLVFDRALDEDVTVAADWFSFESNVLSVESAELSGSTMSLVVSPSATEDAEYELTYTPPESGGLASATGVPGAAFTELVDNVTDYAPYAASASAEATGQALGANQVMLRFDQRLDPSGTFEKSWFAFMPSLEIKSVIVDSSRTEGDQLVIQLEEGHWVREGASVNLKYTQPETGGLRDDDGDPEVQGDGNRVANFTISVQNSVDVAPQLTSATVNRDLVTLEFDQELDEDSVPPPHCEWLEDMLESFDCPTDNPPTWFTVVRHPAGTESTAAAAIASVGVQGRNVTLKLEKRVRTGDSVQVEYQLVSLAGVNNLTLRDSATSPNEVGSFGPVSVTNETAAAPTDGVFDRSEPSMIVVTFDGGLPATSNLNADPLRVTADRKPLAIRKTSAVQKELTVALEDAVPECTALELTYSPQDEPWLDDGNRPITEFSFALDNFIHRALSLACIESDLGALTLSLATDDTLVDQGWSLVVNGTARGSHVESSAGMIRVIPDSSLCVGDSVTINWMPPTPPTLALDRIVDRAAPCIDSAVAVGDRLELTFDQRLDASLPAPDDFAIDRGGQVTGVVGMEGRTVTLQLEPPGLNADADAVLTYAGSSLRGGGLTVGPLSVPITDRTNPPGLTTAFGLDDLIILSFDQPLQQRNVPVSWFELAGPGLDIDIASITISGSSVYLQLKRSLPDDLDLFGVVYLARGTRGLAGMSGVLVPSGVFVVQNYTETAPHVVFAAVNRREAVLTLDQRIDASNGDPADFAVRAGHRRIGVNSLDWSNETITLTLTEPVTSPDATRVIYSPSTEETVRDLSGLSLAAFDVAAENLTPSAKTDAQIVEEARLRAGSGATSVERELARAFASEDGARFGMVPGDGAATVVLGGMRVTIELSQWSEREVGISVSRLGSAARLMRMLEQVPSPCANVPAGSRLEGWLLELQDQYGAPRVEGGRLTLGGLETARLLGGCVLDLITGSWTLMPLDGNVPAPSLIVPGGYTAFTRWVSLIPGA